MGNEVGRESSTNVGGGAAATTPTAATTQAAGESSARTTGSPRPSGHTHKHGHGHGRGHAHGHASQPNGDDTKGTPTSAKPAAQSTPKTTPRSTAANPTPRTTSPRPKSNDGQDGQPKRHVVQGTLTPGMFVSEQSNAYIQRYKQLSLLGKGSYGEVHRVVDQLSGHERAMKIISKERLKKGSKDPKRAEMELREEVEMLKCVDHPNIMKLYEFFEDEKNFYLVAEVYTGGELFDRIIEQKRFSEADGARVIKQVLSGICYMHKLGMAHRDLKPENLVLESKAKDALIKIIDFGFCTKFQTEADYKRVGTAYYIAPEIMSQPKYDSMCDVWSIGVILYILLSGCPPFYGANENEIVGRIMQFNDQKPDAYKELFRLPQWRSVSEPAKELIKAMLKKQPSMRISAQDALEHPWIKKLTASDKPVNLPTLESAILNIRQFKTRQGLAQAALLYIGSRLTSAEETKELTEIFRKLDTDCDGQLDIEELKSGYRELMKLKGVDISKLNDDALNTEVEQILGSIDFDHNGYLNYSEFVAVAMDRRRLLTHDRLKHAFDLFDTDQSGKISAKELHQVLKISGIGEDECYEIVREIDSNKDGEIDFNEFEQMLRILCRV